MEAKELKIQIPKGYEIDKENSTSKYIKFKLIKKDITYREVCDSLFKDKGGFYTSSYGKISDNCIFGCSAMDKNNATNKKQLRRLLALNQLLNIAEYYNKLHIMIDKQYVILYDKRTRNYTVNSVSPCYRFGIEAAFNRVEDAKAVRDNPNFREILDTIYKD